ncbi:MAG TPA: UDP-galactopyranose mutase, partial [Pyrinomonadaceae bacterium]|nr:UDP-galactopyranose mutase [Pyrinomonadaceae bacterium]
MKRFLIVGAGFSGAVLARQLGTLMDCKVLVIDEREHIAGNCHTDRDQQTGVMLHRYGPHIFHTDREDVWDYVRQFGEFGPYINRVKAHTSRGVFSLPINLHTINQFFGKALAPREAALLLDQLGDKTIVEPRNFEEQALRFIGPDLYKTFFYGYTRKQWGCEPTELPASILQRLPIRFNYDDNYYKSRFQGIPRDGYTKVIQRILDHPAVEVKLGVSFERGMDQEMDHTFYSGELDRYFNYCNG